MTRFFTLLVLVLAVATIVTGCTGLGGGTGDDSSDVAQVGTLNIILDYANARITLDGEEVWAKLPDNATKFTVQLLDQNTGFTVFQLNVHRTPDVQSQVVTISPIRVGNYNLRVTAYDSGNNVLGVNNTPVSVQPGTNSVTVATVTPTASPSASPTASPSPSPSPSASASPVP